MNNSPNRKLEEQNFENENELYNSITKEGSLGLLALGYRGLFMWRKKRVELSKEGERKSEKK